MASTSPQRVHLDRESVARLVAERRLRRRRRRSKHSTGSFTANMTPMIDLSFTLLIFFVATTSFQRPEGVLASRLPKVTARDLSTPLPVSPIRVRVQASSNTQEVTVRVERFNRTITSFAELAEFLSEIRQQPGFDGDTPVAILADDDVAWDHVVQVWNSAVRAGFTNLYFGQPKAT